MIIRNDLSFQPVFFPKNKLNKSSKNFKNVSFNGSFVTITNKTIKIVLPPRISIKTPQMPDFSNVKPLAFLSKVANSLSNVKNKILDIKDNITNQLFPGYNNEYETNFVLKCLNHPTFRYSFLRHNVARVLNDYIILDNKQIPIKTLHSQSFLEKAAYILEKNIRKTRKEVEKSQNLEQYEELIFKYDSLSRIYFRMGLIKNCQQSHNESHNLYRYVRKNFYKEIII